MVVTKQRLQILPSSSGLTGRSSIPRAFASISNVRDYWIPAGACHRAAH